MKDDKEDKAENWFKKHIDTIIVIGVLAAGFWNMNEKMWTLTERMNVIEKDVAVIKTVLIMKDLVPKDVSLVSSEK